MNILVINGPNLNMIGIREPDIYGKQSYHDLVNQILDYAKNHRHDVEVYQTNHEGEIIDLIQQNYHRFQGIIINPGAFTHYSYAIYDCLKSIPVPSVEVHLSDIHAREDFRKISVIQAACIGQISGKGFQGYFEAIDLLTKGHKQS